MAILLAIAWSWEPLVPPMRPSDDAVEVVAHPPETGGEVPGPECVVEKCGANCDAPRGQAGNLVHAIGAVDRAGDDDGGLDLLNEGFSELSGVAVGPPVQRQGDTVDLGADTGRIPHDVLDAAVKHPRNSTAAAAGRQVAHLCLCEQLGDRRVKGHADEKVKTVDDCELG